jgi:hypothetical protein
LTPSLTAPPTRGQHSREIVAGLGFAPPEIDAMFADGVLVDLHPRAA